MRKKNKLLLINIILLFTITAYSQQREKVYMPYFEMNNINYDYQLLAAKTFKTYIDNNNKYLLILPDLKNKEYNQYKNFDQIIKNALDINANYFIKSVMNSYYDIMVMSMCMYRTSDTSIVWNDTLLVRTSHDLDTVLKIFAKYIGTDTKASKVNKAYSMSYYLPSEFNKVDATFEYGVSIDAGYTNDYCGNHKVSPGIGLVGSYNSKHFIIDIFGDYLPGSRSGTGPFQLTDIGVEGLLPLKKTKTTTFAGAGILYNFIGIDYPIPNASPNSYAKWVDDGAGGMSLLLTTGYIFNRHKKENFWISVEYRYTLNKIDLDPFDERLTYFIFKFGIMINK